jgi:regulator of replication initiation timing
VKRINIAGASFIIALLLQSCTYAPNNAKVDSSNNYLSRLMAVGGSGKSPEPIVSNTVEEEVPHDKAPQSEAELDSLQGEIEALKTRNESLVKENQELRKQLALHSTPNAPNTFPSQPRSSGQNAQVVNPSASENRPQSSQNIAKIDDNPKQQTEVKFWMTSSSRKRHNSSCRYFQNSNGGPCGPDDGIPCKICGG